MNFIFPNYSCHQSVKSTLFHLSGSLLITWAMSIPLKAQAHTFHDLPPVPNDLMDYIHMADEGTLPDPLDPSKTVLWVAGGRNTFLETGATTNGQYSLFDLYVPPDVGPPLHYHTREAEWFYVIEGEVGFQMDDEVSMESAGSLIYGPKDHLHTFRNLTDDPVRMLLFYEPSGIENFFTEVGQDVTDPINPPGFEPAILIESGARNGLVFPSTFIFATDQFTSDTGVTIVRTGAPTDAVGVTLELSDGTEIPINFDIGESLKTLDLLIPQGSKTVNLLLKSPTNGAQLGLLQNQAVLSRASVPETSFPYGLLAFGVSWVVLRVIHQQRKLEKV